MLTNKKPTIQTTPLQSDTYNSSSIRSFTWRPRENRQDYEHGQLLVRFRLDVESRHEPPPAPQSKVYIYDVPVEPYKEMRWRAEEVRENDREMTVGKWFNNVLPKKPYTPRTKPLHKDCSEQE